MAPKWDDVDGTMVYFCVNVSTNEVAIPAVGDDRKMDGYEMTVTALHGETEGPSKTGPAGAIDRNGTTVNITYLSAHEAYNQRLVIVNRGTREADFWMDTFQTEPGTMVMNEIRGTVAAGSRMIVRVQDHLMINEGGMSRASGTMNLHGAERQDRRHDSPGSPRHWPDRHHDLPAHPVGVRARSIELRLAVPSNGEAGASRTRFLS